MTEPTNWSRFYVPEIHDVWPGAEAELDAMLDVLPSAARPLAALLVVPDWQSRAPLEKHASVCAKVAALPGEKVLHGYTHSLGPEFVNWLLYGHDNRSEFARLTHEEAHERLRNGVGMFERCLGLRPRWFCAPRWQQSAAATEALRSAGFTAYMSGNALEFLSGERVAMPTLNFDEGDRKLKNALMHRLRKGTIDRLLKAGRPFRVALHPADVHDATAWAQVSRVFARLQDEGWQPLSLEQAVDRWRMRAVMA